MLPSCLLAGMMSALGGTGTWMIAATYWEVSTGSIDSIIVSTYGYGFLLTYGFN